MNPLVLQLPYVDPDLVKRAFELLTHRRVSKSLESFVISTETVDHADMKEYSAILLKQYADQAQEFREYIERLPMNKDGQLFAKAIVTGTENALHVSVIVAKRDGNDHKILIATMQKTVIMSAGWNVWAFLFGIETKEQKELVEIVQLLHMEESKKCLEVMTFQLLGEKIQQCLGSKVKIEIVPPTPAAVAISFA